MKCLLLNLTLLNHYIVGGISNEKAKNNLFGKSDYLFSLKRSYYKWNGDKIPATISGYHIYHDEYKSKPPSLGGDPAAIDEKDVAIDEV